MRRAVIATATDNIGRTSTCKSHVKLPGTKEAQPAADWLGCRPTGYPDR
jgi:hypothetical protein